VSLPAPVTSYEALATRVQSLEALATRLRSSLQENTSFWAKRPPICQHPLVTECMCETHMYLRTKEALTLYDAVMVGDGDLPPVESSPEMKFFEFNHLPAKLQEVSGPVSLLARAMDRDLPALDRRRPWGCGSSWRPRTASSAPNFRRHREEGRINRATEGHYHCC